MNDKIFCTNSGFAVKTLFVNSVSRHLGGDHLFDYFSRFGPVRSVRIHVHATKSFGFVKFEGFEAAAKALKIKYHAIDDRKIEVEIADNCHQDEPTTNDELPIELTNATGTELMDLNDDCLREILIRLRPMGLCSLRELSETNRSLRLEAITNEIFTRKFKWLRNDSKTPEVNLERVLAKFGSSIPHFLTDGIDDDDTVSIRKFRSIIERCSGTLKTLKLRNYKFGENDFEAMKSVFGNLEGLDIFRCHFEGDATDLFASCQSLKFLFVYELVGAKEAIFQHTYSSLTRFVCGDLTESLNYNLEDFISRHKKLKLIHLLSLDNHSLLLPIIAENCTNLNTLAVCTNGDENPLQYETSVNSISALTNLKKLIIRDDPNALEFVRQLNHLRLLSDLKLEKVRCVPGIIEALSQLKMLECLHFYNCDEFTNINQLAELCRLKRLYVTSKEVVTVDLTYMVSRLADLEKFVLKLKQSFKIDDTMHSTIADARSKAGSAKLTLTIICNDITTSFRS